LRKAIQGGFDGSILHRDVGGNRRRCRNARGYRFFLYSQFLVTITAYLFFIVVLVIPFDRWLDNRIRPVKPVQDGQP
jgi:hypothetical protein